MHRFFISLFAFLLTLPGHGACESSFFRELTRRVQNRSFSPLATGMNSNRNYASPEILNGYNKIFSQTYHIMQKAESQILFQTWRFDSNSVPAGCLVKALQDLSKKRQAVGARRPVKVWIMVNLTSLSNLSYEIQRMENFIEKHGLTTPYVHVSFGER